MGLPEENELGYNNTDITRNATAFRNKSFFLIHGNADDNVHYQQSMLLAKALELADVQFYQLVSVNDPKIRRLQLCVFCRATPTRITLYNMSRPTSITP